MDLDAAIDELYGMDPAGFTGRRDALAAEARKAGNRDEAVAIKALRRPSAAAHAVNLTARRRGDEIDRLIDLGRRLRQAQEAGSGEELRTLGRQRQQLVAGLAQGARAESQEHGVTLSDAALRDVESTLEAALGDEAAAAAVRQGRLIRSLQRTGLDPVDLEGAVALGGHSSRPAPRTRAPEPAQEADVEEEGRRAETRARARQEQAEAQAAATAAEAAVDRADRNLAAAVSDHEAKTRARAEADDEVARLRGRLNMATDAADRAAAAERHARAARRDAEDEARAARRQADAADRARDRARQRVREETGRDPRGAP